MSIYVPPRVATPDVATKAGPVGPGAGPLLTEFTLDAVFGINEHPRKRMERAWKLSHEVPWIRTAEGVIASRFAGVEWHLEDENDEEVTPETASLDAKAALDLLEYPQRDPSLGSPYTRTELWSLVSRTMGPCGSAFLLMDQREVLAGTPAILQPIAPWRFTAQEDAAGNLIGWWIDRTQTNPGIALRTDEVIHFQLERGYKGHFGIGLVESAMLKLRNSQGLDSHLGMVISAGGRLSGILAPEQGLIEPETMLQMERDWRTVVEQQDAAKRLQLVRAPVKFTPTTLTPHELMLKDMMNSTRDDLLALWGVPYTMIGGAAPSGLNSGDTRKYDEAALWQGPVHSRLTVFREGLQYQMLDLWAKRGAVVELEIDEPTFDDDGPRYDLLGKSLNTPLTNRQRLELVGLPPTGDPSIDDAILLPATIVPYAQAPSPEAGGRIRVIAPEPALLGSGTPQSAAAGETTDDGKARMDPLHASLTKLRANLDRTMTPQIRKRVAEVLTRQKTEVSERIRKHAGAIERNPKDHTVWWNAAKWDKELSAALRGTLEGVAQTVQTHIGEIIPAQKAGPLSPVERVLERGAARVTRINETTRDAIRSAIIGSIEAGHTANEAADAVEAAATFEPYRSEMIARTELMDAYNASAIASYQDAGVTEVQAIDGDGDEECAARDGKIYPADEAYDIEDHPNGTLDWVPVIDYGALREAFSGKALVVSPPIVPIQQAPLRMEIIQVKADNSADMLAAAIEQFATAHAEGMAAMRAVQSDAMDRIGTGMEMVGSKIDALASVPHPVTIPDGAVVVNVAAPVVNVPAAIVNVAAPTIPEPIVVVQPAPVARTKTVIKNNNGSYTITER